MQSTMKNTKLNLFLGSYNDLSKNFWEQHLITLDNINFLPFKPDEATIEQLESEPDLIIIDSYFTSENHLADPEGKAVYRYIKERFPNTRTYFLSPSYFLRSEDLNKNLDSPTVFSNLSSEVLQRINEDISKMYPSAA